MWLALAGLLLVLLAWSAYFSSSETALFSLDRLALRELKRNPDRASLRVLHLLARPHRLLATLLLGNTLVGIAASSVATLLFVHVWPGGGIWLPLVVMNALLLMVGEIVPKSLALNFPLGYARWSVILLSGISRVVSPVVSVATRLADLLVYRGEAPGESDAAPGGIRPAELRRLLEEVREQGALNDEETLLLRRVLRFSDTELVEVMTPWVDVARVARDAPRREVERRVRESHHSRLPVYGSDKDDVVGYLTAKTYLANPAGTVADHLRPMLVLPEGTRAREALIQMRALHRQMVLVVSEHGRPLGIVSVEDLVEEIVGELYDEFETEERFIVPLDSGKYLVSGQTPVAQAEETLGIPLRAAGTEFVTVNGFLCHLAGEIPPAGTRIHRDGVLFEVLEVERNRITWCEATLPGSGAGRPAAPGRRAQ